MDKLRQHENTFVELWEADVSGRDAVIWQRVWQIGGEQGWYYGTRLWKLRGIVDKLLGGVGYRKGRPSEDLQKGDQVDFWRVVNVDKSKQYLKLEAEMNLPGKVWITYEVKAHRFTQKIEFMPHGALGKLYWHLVKPFHHLLFTRMFQAIVR